MANRSKKTKNPHFFKFMLGNFSERMMIPPAFRENVKDVASGHAIIKGPSGNIWHVELAKDDHGICFQNGWQGFVRDHSLQMGDVLVFRYDGDLQFTVRVFDSSACEKEDAFCVKVCGTEVKKEKIELRDPPSNLLEVSHYGAQKTTTKRKRGMGKQVPQQRRSCMRSASSRKIEEPSAKPKLDETVDSLKENNPPAVGQEKIKYISHYGAQKTTTKRKHGLYKQVPQQRRSCTRSASSRKTEEPSDKPKLDETVDSFMENNPPAASQEKIKNIQTQSGNPPFSQKRLLIDEEKEMESVAANSKNHKCVTSAKVSVEENPAKLLEVSHYGAQKTTTKRKRGLYNQVPQQQRSCTRSASSRKTEEPSDKPKLDETVDSFMENNPPAASQEKIKNIKTQPGNPPFSEKRLLIDEEKEMESVAANSKNHKCVTSAKVSVEENPAKLSEVSHYGAQKTTTKRKHGLYKQVPQQQRSCTRSASSRKTEEPSDKPKLDETVDSFMENNPPAASQEKIKYIKTQPGNPPFSQKRLLIDEEKEMESVAANSKNHKCVTSAKVSVEENPAKLSEVSHYEAQKATSKRKRGLHKQISQQQRPCTRSAFSRRKTEGTSGQAERKLDETADSFKENNPPTVGQAKQKFEKETESEAPKSKNNKSETCMKVSMRETLPELSEVSPYGAQETTSKRKHGLHKQVPQQRCSCTRSASSSNKTEGPSGQAKQKLDETANSFKENNPPTAGQGKRKYVNTHLGNPPFSRKRLHIDEEKEMEFEASNSKNHKSMMYYSKANKRKFDKFCSGYRPLTQRRVVTEEEKKRALKEANSFESDNPFAVIVMRQSYVYTGTCMSFPAEFTRDHLPKANQKMVLEDTEGGAWSVQYLYYQSGSSLSAGWRALVYDKTIEEDDVCVFELMKEAVFRVHVFRVVKEITRMIKNGKKSNPRAGFGRVKVDC